MLSTPSWLVHQVAFFVSCLEAPFQSGSLKRPGSSRQLPSNLRILQNPISSGFNPEGIYVWHYLSLGGRHKRGTKDSKLPFWFVPMMNRGSIPQAAVCFFSPKLHTTWSHTLCTDAKEQRNCVFTHQQCWYFCPAAVMQSLRFYL